MFLQGRNPTNGSQPGWGFPNTSVQATLDITFIFQNKRKCYGVYSRKHIYKILRQEINKTVEKSDRNGLKCTETLVTKSLFKKNLNYSFVLINKAMKK